MSLVSCYRRSLDAQFGTPDPRSAGFDTDIGAFIESSTVPWLEGSMAPSIIYNNTALRETFPPPNFHIRRFRTAGQLAQPPRVDQQLRP